MGVPAKPYTEPSPELVGVSRMEALGAQSLAFLRALS